MTQVSALMTPAWPINLTKEQKLQKWLDAKTNLDAAKAIEAELRKSVVDAYPFDADKAEGTQRIPLANDYELKVVKKLNYKLDSEATDEALSRIEKLDAQGKFIAERLVKWSPSLSISEYRDLDAKYRGIIDDVLTVTPGLPTLELVEPKAKK